MKKIFLSAFMLLLATGVQAQNTPLMGWSSWNTFALKINEKVINEQADAMVKFGLKDAGYSYINIDDGYFGLRAEDGTLLMHPTRFPQGLKGIVDHVHSLGLKAGIYSDAGDNTCGSGNGSNDKWGMGVGLFGHEQQDCDFFFKQLGFDFIKVDFCGGNHLLEKGRTDRTEKDRYTSIAQSIKNTGRTDVRLNVCRWAYPGNWISQVAESWRTTGDIYCAWESVKGILAENLYLSAYSSKGHYNDMDMLEVGRGLSEEEDKTHFGMWCIMNSPLLIGCDMRNIPEKALALLKNKDLIALNQDPLGQQAYIAGYQNGVYVMVRDLQKVQDLTRAVALYNPTDEPAHVSLPLSQVELSGKTLIHDCFEQKDLKPITNGQLVADIPAHGTRIYTLKAEQRVERVRYEAETAYISDYQELESFNKLHTGQYADSKVSSCGYMARELGKTEQNDLRFRDVYSQKGGTYQLTIAFFSQDEREMTVEVNGKKVDRLSLQTPSWTILGTTTLSIPLNAGKNEIRFYNAGDYMPDIDYIEIKK